MVHVTMKGAEIRGTLTVNPQLRELNLVDTSVRGMAAPQGVALKKANITGTGVGGAVPEWLLNAPELEELIISNNSFTSMPATWHSPNLRVLRAAANSLPVRSSPSVLTSSCEHAAAKGLSTYSCSSAGSIVAVIPMWYACVIAVW
jgi:hypothetical protein